MQIEFLDDDAIPLKKKTSVYERVQLGQAIKGLYFASQNISPEVNAIATELINRFDNDVYVMNGFNRTSGFMTQKMQQGGKNVNG